MRKYTVIAVLTIQAGAVLGLTPKQAELRKHALKPVGKDAYEVLSPIQFKVGEEIATDAELNKALATSLESADTTKEKARASARDKAAAKDLAELQAKADQWDAIQPALAALQATAAAFALLPEQDRVALRAQADAAAAAAAQSQAKK